MTFEEFTSYPRSGTVPKRLDYEKQGVREVSRLELLILRPGTIIQFHGMHPDSIYLMEIIGPEKRKRVKIWHKGKSPAAITDISNIVSMDFPKEILERGVMKVGKNYRIPTFEHDPKNPEYLHLLSTITRLEHYTLILVKEI